MNENIKFVMSHLNFMINTMCKVGYSDPELYDTLTDREKSAMRKVFFHLNSTGKPKGFNEALSGLHSEFFVRKPYSLGYMADVYMQYNSKKQNKWSSESEDFSIPPEDFIIEALRDKKCLGYFKDISEDFEEDATSKTTSYFFDGNTVRIDTRHGLFDFCLEHNIPESAFNYPVIISKSIKNCRALFKGFISFNSPVTFMGDVEDCSFMFQGCCMYNQPIDIPESVKYCSYMFDGCYAFNQSMKIPSSVKDCSQMFHNCHAFNQSVSIPNSVESCNSMFHNCYSFNKPLVLPDSIKNCGWMFCNCHSFNSKVNIPSFSESCEMMFSGCSAFNQAVAIPESAKNCAGMFRDCASLDTFIAIPEGVENCERIFHRCSKYTHDIYIPNSVKECIDAWGIGVRKVSVPKNLYVYSLWTEITVRD